MAFERIKKLFSPPQKNKNPIDIAAGLLWARIEEPEKFIPGKIKNHRSSVMSHERHGGKLVSFAEVEEQIGKERIPNTVITDNSPQGFGVGNYWRVEGRVTNHFNGKENVNLRFCRMFGNYDIPGKVIMPTPETRAMFTGAIVQDFRIEGEKATLEEVTLAVNSADEKGEICPVNINFVKSERYYSNGEGVLVLRSSE